ncbi:hypothetical protein BBF96_05450 [Anoxybacter fermentans]|uniref:GrdX protein n=1 Tax=Anoxybacter fermentans TaxID=1323375 RepID=A0A3Q9HQ26_9FIRM|nr:GrdX family protein [Anoxybacter fermentans]AZR72882.1 hypothetical protein BBF96_05450 [Anoxybacter fermentans]
MRQILIITNNPAVIERYKQQEMIIEKTVKDVLIRTRDLVHIGHKLISHPMAGSIKPNATPYRSIMVSLKPGKLDFNSLSIIEDAIRKFEQFQKDHPIPNWSENVLKDFQELDLTLLTSGYQSLVE